ncbi:hypothetical protein SAMN05216503_2045 [Polaribacter sp. KT25b]|uniref:hypothetical protein n=1 Tax=Polaribacter sp. KT25b TaxID=1855336 RepID=UPI00087A297F|nr:hypothetical protein [Polaribacter sp. KT25b]SDS12299.1 hypothetical protein SAMN05216503_2045 [Polaribacter sp. KT25b]
MKQILNLLSIFSIILFQNCNLNDCGQACFTPPNSFQFEFVDATTNENLFINNTFNKNEIQVINLTDNKNIDFTFIDENDYNILSINSISWQTETVEYSLKIADKDILTLYVDADAKRVNENCCSFTHFEEIRIENSNYTFDNTNGIYTILID